MELRKTMSHGSTWAVCLDATRLSTREYQSGPIMNVDSQMRGWLAPVVPRWGA